MNKVNSCCLIEQSEMKQRTDVFELRTKCNEVSGLFSDHFLKWEGVEESANGQPRRSRHLKEPIKQEMKVLVLLKQAS